VSAGLESTPLKHLARGPNLKACCTPFGVEVGLLDELRVRERAAGQEDEQRVAEQVAVVAPT
jgi:hypothetical protein